MNEQAKLNFYRKALWAIFAVYLLVLLKITLFKDGIINVGVNAFNRDTNFIPFKSTIEIIRFLPLLRAAENIVGNIAIFVPLGFLLSLLTKLRGGTVIAGAVTSVIIETLQYIFMLGFTDIDDVIYNTFGTAFGFLAAFMLKGKCESEISLFRTAAVLISVCGAVGVAVLAANGILM